MPPHPAPAGPEFLAVDRRNAVVVDASGVSFENHGMNLDLTWPEIRGVHYKANGNVLVVGVAHVDGRFFECAVDAKRGDRLGSGSVSWRACWGTTGPWAEPTSG